MSNFCLQDAIELGTAERLRRFKIVVSDIFVQDWVLSTPKLPPEPMWIAQDSGGGLSITRGSAQPMTATCIDPQPPGKRTYYALTSNRPYRVRLGRRELALGGGDVVLLSNAQACSVICTRSHISSAFIIDGAAFESLLPEPSHLLGRRFSDFPDASALLRKTMRLAWTCSKSRTLGRAAPLLIRSFLDHLALIDLIERSGPAAPAQIDSVPASAACRDRVMGFIDRHFHRPELSIAVVSEALDMSTRYIQLCFSQVEQTPSDYLRRKRLAAAAAMLRGIESSDLSVTEVAYACGFGSSSYFSTEFRKAFGLKPSEFRRVDSIGVIGDQLPSRPS
ncbi:MAG: AraC family transcriptional regulator [Pseudomonadota bacterium]|nr:AraC family transcriptional regulator [Pseudomonadota bacterium]